jgi:AraC family transcriptional regulator
LRLEDGQSGLSEAGCRPPSSHPWKSCLNREGQPDFFDGDVLRWCEFAGLTVGEIHYPAGWERPKHRHERACFHFLLQGGCTERHGTESSESKTFSLSFQPRGFEHSYRGTTESVSRVFTIELGENWLARLQEHSVVIDHPINFQGGVTLWLMTRLYNEFRSMQSDSGLLSEALTLEIAVETSRRKRIASERKPPVWLHRVTDLLNDRFTEPLSLSQIAASVDVHPVHLARTFRQFHHCTVGEYLRRVRIEFACRKVAESNSRLVEIALAAGFSDQSQFCHTFKRTIGMTPAEFRSAIRGR